MRIKLIKRELKAYENDKTNNINTIKTINNLKSSIENKKKIIEDMKVKIDKLNNEINQMKKQLNNERKDLKVNNNKNNNIFNNKNNEIIEDINKNKDEKKELAHKFNLNVNDDMKMDDFANFVFGIHHN